MKKRADAFEKQSGEHTRLAELSFEQDVASRLEKLRSELPSHADPSLLAQKVLSYLDYANKTVRVRIHGKERTITALEAVQRSDYELIGNDEEIIEGPVPLIVFPDFRLLDETMRALRERANELGLQRKGAEALIQKIANRSLPDQRPRPVQRGEFRERIIQELKVIRAKKAEIRSFKDLEDRLPNFEVVRVVKGSSFSNEDRECLAAPGRWETKPATYAHGILKKYWGLRSEETLKKYRKAWSKHSAALRKQRK